MSTALGEDIYIYRGDGEPFESGKLYIDAFDLGFPKKQLISSVTFTPHLGGGFLSFNPYPIVPVITVNYRPATFKTLYIYPELNKISTKMLLPERK